MTPDSVSVKTKMATPRAYVGRMLRLTSLAPDIIEAILRGDLSRRSGVKTDEPDGLSLEKLRKNLPVRWDEQQTAMPCLPDPRPPVPGHPQRSE